jgi:ATP-dependent Clp protease ATP-binding subunit ClpA
MLQIRREAVYTKLHPIAFTALQSAFELARARGNAFVELAHWLNQILMLPDSDLHRVVAAFGIDRARLAADLNRSLERFRPGGTDLPDFSEHVDRAIERTSRRRSYPSATNSSASASSSAGFDGGLVTRKSSAGSTSPRPVMWRQTRLTAARAK